MLAPSINPPIGHALVVDDLPEGGVIVRALERAGLVITHVQSVSAALEALRQPEPPFDVAVLRHHVAGETSLPIVSAIGDLGPMCSVLVLSQVNSPVLASDYRRRGAYRFITTPRPPSAIVEATLDTLRDTHRWRCAGRAPAKPPVPSTVVVDIDAATDRIAYLANLSPAERTVTYWLLQGHRDGQIAEFIDRAPRTVKRHVGGVLCKTGAQNRSSLWSILCRDGAPRVGYRSATSPPQASSPPDEIVEPAAARGSGGQDPDEGHGGGHDPDTGDTGANQGQAAAPRGPSPHRHSAPWAIERESGPARR